MSNKVIDIINIEYESSSMVTEQYKNAKRAFKSRMKKLFLDCEVIIGSCPHFEFTGFIKKDGKFVYFSTGDLRYRIMDSMLVRTAKHDKDWTGGSNNFVQYHGEDFDERLKTKAEQLLKYD